METTPLERPSNETSLEQTEQFGPELEGLAPGAAATLFGTAMCVIFQKTKSLYPGMTIHALHNCTVVVLAATLS